MKIKIAGRHTDAGPELRDYIIEKTEALERFFDRIISVDVVLSVEKERHIADFHAHLTNHKTINAREETTDMYASIDTAIDRLKRQLLKFKDQLQEFGIDLALILMLESRKKFQQSESSVLKLISRNRCLSKKQHCNWMRLIKSFSYLSM